MRCLRGSPVLRRARPGSLRCSTGMRRVRLGVDVGGTFTDVVAIDADGRELIGTVKVPTTHCAPEGVAAGIVEGLRTMLEHHRIEPADVAFIAHSTTQATNALLEGDIALVGVLGIPGSAGWLAQRQMRFGAVSLAPGITFAPHFAFARSAAEMHVHDAIDRLQSYGAQSVAVTAPFSVDDSTVERRAVEAAQARGLFATSGHDVSEMYGLRARTRTAALNASILPKMVRTARMTADAVRDASIAAPLMIMRSDGGVMDVREIERRPILTMLSGPAAGVAGALLYENVTDAIFLEVGGTSVDICAIRGGRAQMRPASVGGHRTMLRTIDARTLGIAGGSIPRASHGRIVDVGPRSAHIAGCAYASFLDATAFEGAVVERFAPSPHDADDYVRFRLRDGTYAAVTPTCASNLLGYVPADAFAHGNADAVLAAFETLAQALGATAHALAEEMLQAAARKILPTLDALIADYALERAHLVLVGGGGGACALVPFLARYGGFEHRIARDAEVISPIGVALALVRDVVERTIVAPTTDDIVRIRREASDRAIASGASPERIEVAVEIDAQSNRVRAIASGASAMAEPAARAALSIEERMAIAARLLDAPAGNVRRMECTALLDVFIAGDDARVIDERGVARLALRRATFVPASVGALAETLRDAIEAQTTFGDVGRALPALYLIHGARIADFSGLASAEQALTLANEEVGGRSSTDPVVIVTVRRQA